MSRAGARSCSSTRSTASTRPSRTPCCPAVEDGLRRPDRRHHREPVLRGQRPAAVPVDAVPARALSPTPSTCGTAPQGPRGGAGRGRRRGPRPPRRTGRRRRPPGAHRARGGRRPRAAAADAPPRVDAGRRRGCARHQRPALRRRRALRRDLRVHQVDPRLRPRRRPLLAGPHGRGRRGRPLHRPPAGHPRLRGHRHGRPDGARGGQRRRPGRRVRGAARGRPQPGPGRGPPGHRPQVESRRPWAGGRPRPTSATARRARCRRTCGTPTTRGPKVLGHGEGYRYPHDDPRGWVEQEHLPAEVRDRRYYDPSAHGYEADVRDRLSRIVRRES